MIGMNDDRGGVSICCMRWERMVKLTSSRKVTRCECAGMQRVGSGHGDSIRGVVGKFSA